VRLGLFFSALGDGALVWEEGFLLGMLNFSVGHYFYIRSVRTDKLLGDNLVFSLSLALVLYGASAAIYLHFLQAGLVDPVLAVGVPVYILWLTTTVWRSGVAGRWLMFVGAVFFMVSDCIIGINMFYAPVPHHQVWIMSTYHIAQFLIALSAILGSNGDQKKIK